MSGETTHVNTVEKKYAYCLLLFLHSMVNNISNDYSNDEWSPIDIA